MIKAYKYRIYPNAKQAELIDKTISYCRFVYNLALEIRIYAWQTQGKNVSIYNLCSQLTDLKKECPWLSLVDSQALQSAVIKLDKSYSIFFNGGGYPKFKSKRRGSQSFQCRNGVRRLDWVNRTLTIPKIKEIRISPSRMFDGKIKTVNINKTPTGKYYASIVVDDGLLMPIKKTITREGAIGIDVGIKSYIVTSDNTTYAPNRKLKENINRLNCLKRRLARKLKGSKNRGKANKKYARLHERVANQRLDYIHKSTHKIISDNQANTFVVEDLNISGMLKNKTLSQAISDVSFGEFFRQMKYKCDWVGKNLITIGRFFPSSKSCSNCGFVNDLLTLDDRIWACSDCGSIHDRDFNAAINIRNQGIEKHFINTNTGGHPERVCGVVAVTSGNEAEKSLKQG